MAAIAVGFAVLLLACGGLRTSQVIEAPMTNSDASASEIALYAVPMTAQAGDPHELPIEVGDRFTGHYTCNQGKTDLVLIVEEVIKNDDEAAEVVVVFEFHFDGNGNPGFPKSEGASRLRGTYETKGRRLRLEGQEWITQPPGYQLVNLVGNIGKNGSYTGTVEGLNCTTFVAARERKGETSPPNSSRSLPRPGP
jgi:hypothetical protein